MFLEFMKSQTDKNQREAETNRQAMKGLCQAVEQVAENCRVSVENAQNAKATPAIRGTMTMSFAQLLVLVSM